MRVKNSTTYSSALGESLEKPIEPGPRRAPRRVDKRFGLKPEYAAIAKQFCELGATSADLAKAFGVDRDTISLWQSTNRVFAEACRLGEEAAAQRVERGLFERAVGYTQVVETVVKQKSRISIVKLKVPVPPDPRASKTWLERRDAKADLTREDPLAQLRRQLEGTALRPKDQG